MSEGYDCFVCNLYGSVRDIWNPQAHVTFMGECRTEGSYPDLIF